LHRLLLAAFLGFLLMFLDIGRRSMWFVSDCTNDVAMR
jgi:hypothetical protein